MENKTCPGLILLTYKGKALLMYKKTSPIDEINHVWSFIEETRQNKESFEHTLVRRVEKEMGIKIDNVEFISDSYYRARLTDDNVNQIKRAEGQMLDFFTLKELENLLLSSLTARFVLKYGDLIN